MGKFKALRKMLYLFNVFLPNVVFGKKIKVEI